jgi:hypothetical protein
MRIAHLLPLLIVCATQTANIAIAAPDAGQARTDTTLAAESAARKGTRLYGSDGTAPALPAVPDTPQAQSPGPSDALEQCMSTWDAGTHITKSKWREICQRQLRDQATDAR